MEKEPCSVIFIRAKAALLLGTERSKELRILVRSGRCHGQTGTCPGQQPEDRHELQGMLQGWWKLFHALNSSKVGTGSSPPAAFCTAGRRKAPSLLSSPLCLPGPLLSTWTCLACIYPPLPSRGVWPAPRAARGCVWCVWCVLCAHPAQPSPLQHPCPVTALLAPRKALARLGFISEQGSPCLRGNENSKE